MFKIRLPDDRAFYLKKNLSLLVLLFSLFYTCNNNLIASEIKIKQIRFDNYYFHWSERYLEGFVKYSKLDNDGLPEDLVILFPHRSISFNLSVIGAAKLVLRNKLEHFDKNWINCDTKKPSTYYNLKNGKYTYWVQGLQQGKVICEKKITFEIDRNYRFQIGEDILRFLISIFCIYGIIKMK